ncbi:MAG: DNA alkylation repair protein [Bacteroidales bacterium]
MNKIEKKFNEIRLFCEQHANEAIVKKYSKFFTEGYNAYGLSQEIFETQRDKWIVDWKNEMNIDDYLALGEKLVSSGKYEEASFAITFIICQLESLEPKMFEVFELWLSDYILNWAHTDVLSGRILYHFIKTKMANPGQFKPWTNSPSVWKRRAVPVTFVEVLKEKFDIQLLLGIIEPLMTDKEKKVQQGLGWFLREAWKISPVEIEIFLKKWKDTCGRTIVQYATEKMDKNHRLQFRKEKNKFTD